MQIFFILIIFLAFYSCSFDNKTGIWKNSNQIVKKKRDELENFKKINTEDKLFDKIILPKNNLDINLGPIKNNLKWEDEFYQASNNLENFSYRESNSLIFKSKKLTRNKINSRILFDGKNALFTDEKGNIYVYSTEYQNINYKYNFYKKKFKKIKKKLNIKIEKNIVYVSDNLGYLYAINYNSQKLIWAKNFQIPFRSNLKIIKNKLILADSDNSIYLVNKFNGEKIKTLPTEDASINNEFINSFASYGETFFYLNTFGSIYSINSNNGRINWFFNINPFSENDNNNLFNSKPIILNNNKVIIATDRELNLFNADNGSRVLKFPITSSIKPIIMNQNLFLITKDDLLVSINIEKGDILYSIDINNEIAKFLNSKKKKIYVKSFSILNNSLYIFLDNSFFIKFSSDGKLQNIGKLSAKIHSDPIFINGSILFFDKKNKLIILN